MLLKKLKVDYFGKFSKREINLKPGINIIYGENEAGKSTLHAFIKGMLFGIERLRGRGAASKEDVYSRYLPWDYPGAYKGQMDIKVKDKFYRLQRSFHANNRSFTIINLETGRELKLKEGHISELIPGLTESSFCNTISIEQLKAQTDTELASQVRNYITNLSIAKSKEVNVEKAVRILKEKKKALESIPYDSQIKDLSKEIEEGMEKEEKIDALTTQLRQLEKEWANLNMQLNKPKSDKHQKEEELMGKLPVILEKYNIYNNLSEEYSSLKKQAEELKDKIAEWEDEAKGVFALKDSIYEAQMLSSKCEEYLKKLHKIYNKDEEESKNIKKIGLIYIAIPIVMSLFTYLVTKSLMTGALLFLLLLIIGGAFYIYTLNKYKNILLDNQRKENEIKERYLESETRINSILEKYQVASVQKLVQKQEEYLKLSVSIEHSKELLSNLNERIKELEDRCDQLHDTIMLYMRSFISEEELTYEAIERLSDVINTKINETEKKQSQIKSKLDECNLKIEKIRWELSLMEDNEVELNKNKEQHKYLIQKQKENDMEIAAINMALDTIGELSVEIHDSFGRDLDKAVSKIISGVTDGKYRDIKIDEKLNIKMGWKDNYIILDRLSAGTIDQVYFALRLAVADLLLGKNTMPLLLDDTFALYDDNRLKALLTQIKDRPQVLIFTCQKRERIFLKELNIPFNYIKI
ncbi:ATP-binding protein [Herbinix luporum]|uniref:ATP-binding protein n=1 Tax=Herbinix luporum TaxID=1679721 RepID=UPI0023F51624|nr:AAA family ATPase [Herbinix luporum]